tara:strand:- start:819 stop:1250 length:432 start_codon:yes stop_codon:yes gene_type:complete
MVLHRKQTESGIKALYKSSNILASIYSESTKELEIIFKRGSRYLYENVTATDYTRFELADSQGKVLNSHIKAYTFKKLDDVDPKSIETSILTYRSAEIDNLYTNGLSDILSLIDGAPEKYDNKILNTITDKCSKLIETIKQYG